MYQRQLLIHQTSPWYINLTFPRSVGRPWCTIFEDFHPLVQVHLRETPHPWSIVGVGGTSHPRLLLVDFLELEE